MPFKQFDLDDDIQVSIYKRRGVKNMRLTIVHGSKIRVTIPYWVPYAVGMKFAESKKSWIYDHFKPKTLLKHGDVIGKSHKLIFSQTGESIKTRIVGNEIRVVMPRGVDSDNQEVQRLAEVACNRALTKQASDVLPGRLQYLADIHGFKFKSVKVKKMKTRWGSCDSRKNIILNIYLMQLSWDVIDYVLLHELTHTRLMKHGPEFWTLMEEVLPDTSMRRKAIRGHKPTLQVSS